MVWFTHFLSQQLWSSPMRLTFQCFAHFGKLSLIFPHHFRSTLAPLDRFASQCLHTLSTQFLHGRCGSFPGISYRCVYCCHVIILKYWVQKIFSRDLLCFFYSLFVLHGSFTFLLMFGLLIFMAIHHFDPSWRLLICITPCLVVSLVCRYFLSPWLFAEIFDWLMIPCHSMANNSVGL